MESNLIKVIQSQNLAPGHVASSPGFPYQAPLPFRSLW